MRYRWLLVWALLVGCTSDDDAETVDAGTADACVPPPRPEAWLIDPRTGECHDFGTPAGPVDCKSPRLPPPPFPACETVCTPFGESACIGTAGCHAVYTGNASAFTACWGLRSPDPGDGPACAEIESPYECVDREDCLGIYSAIPGEWLDCVDEP